MKSQGNNFSQKIKCVRNERKMAGKKVYMFRLRRESSILTKFYFCFSRSTLDQFGREYKNRSLNHSCRPCSNWLKYFWATCYLRRWFWQKKNTNQIKKKTNSYKTFIFFGCFFFQLGFQLFCWKVELSKETNIDTITYGTNEHSIYYT